MDYNDIRAEMMIYRADYEVIAELMDEIGRLSARVASLLKDLSMSK